jgi:hypothetical protein
MRRLLLALAEGLSKPAGPTHLVLVHGSGDSAPSESAQITRKRN